MLSLFSTLPYLTHLQAGLIQNVLDFLVVFVNFRLLNPHRVCLNSNLSAGMGVLNDTLHQSWFIIFNVVVCVPPLILRPENRKTIHELPCNIFLSSPEYNFIKNPFVKERFI